MDSEYQNPGEENYFGVKDNDLALYASVPPWEYMIHYTSVASTQTVYRQEDSNAENNATKKLKQLLTNIENLLNELKNHIISTCCTTTIENNTRNEMEIEKNSLMLSEKMSILLGLHGKCSTKLFVVDGTAMEFEYKRCSSVVDAVLQMLSYKDTEDGNLIFDDPSSMPTLKEEETEIGLGDCELGMTSYSTSPQANKSVQENLKIRESKLCVERENNLDLDYNICDTNALLPVGYLLSYCIPENVYSDIIIKGKPYTCLCERKFHNRNVFENHIDGNCLGKEGETRKKELQSKFRTIEGNQYQCIHQDCNQNFKSILSLNQHHQTDHLKDIVCPYKCDKCKKTFFLKVLLNSHCKETHFEDAKEVCKICGKDMKTPKKLRLHLKSHDEYKSSVDIPTQKDIELEAHNIVNSRPGTLDVVDDAPNIFVKKKYI